jgi:hypothetical protein
MSADLYSYEDDNADELDLEMNVHGMLTMNVYSGDGTQCVYFLSSKNVEDVKRLIGALQAWVDHVEETK